MGIIPDGAGTVINIFSVCVIILVIMFSMGKITFKQLFLICLSLIIIAMLYLKYTQPKQPAEDKQLNTLIKSFTQQESNENSNP